VGYRRTDCQSALPCPVADRFAAADQTYATITDSAFGGGAASEPSELERHLEGMGGLVLRKLLQAHLTCASRARRSNRCGCGGHDAHAHPGSMRASGRASFGEVEVARTGLMEPQAHPVCTRWTGALQSAAGEVSLEVRRRVAMEAAKELVDEG